MIKVDCRAFVDCLCHDVQPIPFGVLDQICSIQPWTNSIQCLLHTYTHHSELKESKIKIFKMETKRLVFDIKVILNSKNTKSSWQRSPF